MTDASAPTQPAAPGVVVPTGAEIEATAARIAPWVRQTPLLELDLEGQPVSLKLECLQVSGTFKARGAFARLLNAETAGHSGPRRVVAASGGNHGIAVALAAKALGWSADIFVPQTAPAAKLERLRALGATVHATGTEFAQAWAASQEWARAHQALESHAYDQFDTLCGQATLGREWLQQTRSLDVLLVAVGGGGLIGGIAAWLEAASQRGERVPRLVAVESEGCPTLHAALAAGRIVEIEPSGRAADSLGARRVGATAFALAQRRVTQSICVPDPAIAAAQASLWRVARIAVEPGGAVSAAALLSGRYRPAPGERVGVLVCGANVDLRGLADTLDSNPA